jgi:molecular chaperone HscB
VSDRSHFALLGLPEAFAIDSVALESAWRRLQAAVHPDRHVQGAPGDRRLALQLATQVNEAYRVLRDAQRRAAYLCGLRGVDLQVESNTSMPGAFLMQQMQWREALDEAREARDIAALTSLQEQIESVRHALIGQIAMLLDESGDAPAAGGCVRQLMFLDRLAEEVDFAEQDLSGV